MILSFVLPTKEPMLYFHSNDEHILYIPFQSEEMENALNKLKLKKSRWSHSRTLQVWRSPPKAVVTADSKCYDDLESIPDVLNLAILTPVYKGAGKDPMERESYRDISVTPVISKLLETQILMRLEPYLQELGIPQNGYRRHTSCTDTIFSTVELMAHCL